MREKEARTDLRERTGPGQKLVEVLKGDLRTVQLLQARCHEAGLTTTVTAAGPPGGWGIKVSLLVEKADLPKMAGLLRSQWEEELARNGLEYSAPRKDRGTEDGVTCPACGMTAPLEDGACSDCGLTLG